jgi:uncharacterized membrane protein YebE (DUF533 family)
MVNVKREVLDGLLELRFAEAMTRCWAPGRPRKSCMNESESMKEEVKAAAAAGTGAGVGGAGGATVGVLALAARGAATGLSAGVVIGAGAAAGAALAYSAYRLFKKRKKRFVAPAD